MRKSIVLPVIAAAGGIVGFVLRRWELASAFESDTGLPIPNAPAFWALVCFSAVIAAALLFLCRGKHQAFEGGYDQAFAAKGNTVYVTAMVLSGFLLLAGGILSFLALPDEYTAARAAAGSAASGVNPGMSALMSTFPKALTAVLAVVSFLCVLSVGRNSYRGECRGKLSLPLLAPGYMAALWLISTYQSRAGDPIRQDYIYELLAIIALLLAVYFIASFSFERGKVARTVFFSLMAVYFSIVTLADRHSLAHTLFYCALGLYLAAQATALIFNDAPRMCQRSAERPEEEAELETEEKTDEG